MRIRLYIFMVLLVIGLCAGRVQSAVALSNLTNPTLQTLIDLGSDGVTVGPLRFHDFAFNSPDADPPLPTSIAVFPLKSPTEDGLRFASTWATTTGITLSRF